MTNTNGKDRKNNKRNRNIIFLFVAFLIFAAGYFAGYARTIPTGNIIPESKNQLTSKDSVDFENFWKSWDLINEQYDGDIDHQKMLYGAIAGMVSSLGDPYTTFMDPDQAKSFENELSGTLSGIGAEIGMKKGYITIIAPLAGTPAEKSGLKAGDIIIKIDGQSTEGLSVDEAVSKIRGTAGTEVSLVVDRNGESKEYKIIRETINVKSVDYKIEDGLLKISISRFDEDTAGLVKAAESEGIEKNVKGVVIDLRNNPGGYLSSAIDVGSEFIASGVVVSERSSENDSKKEYKVSGKGLMTDANKYPLVVLVNGGSASASEIFSGPFKTTEEEN
jgi:carboxyl-terminal processing protease